MKKYLLLLFFVALLASCGKEEPKVKALGAPKIVGKALSDGYSCDSTHYYYIGDTIEVAQSSTFKVLGGGYAKDGYSAYYKGKEVQGAQGASFRWVAGDTAADVMDTYIKGEQQPLKPKKQ